MDQRGVVLLSARVPKRAWRWLSLEQEALHSKLFPARTAQLAKGTNKEKWPHHEREALQHGGAIYPEVLAQWHVGHSEADVGRPGFLRAQGLQFTLKLLYKVLPGYLAGTSGELKVSQGSHRPGCMPTTNHRSHLSLKIASL